MNKHNVATADQLDALARYYAVKEAREAARAESDRKLGAVCYSLAVLCVCGSAYFTGAVLSKLSVFA